MTPTRKTPARNPAGTTTPAPTKSRSERPSGPLKGPPRAGPGPWGYQTRTGKLKRNTDRSGEDTPGGYPVGVGLCRWPAVMRCRLLPAGAGALLATRWPRAGHALATRWPAASCLLPAAASCLVLTLCSCAHAHAHGRAHALARAHPRPATATAALTLTLSSCGTRSAHALRSAAGLLSSCPLSVRPHRTHDGHRPPAGHEHEHDTGHRPHHRPHEHGRSTGRAGHVDRAAQSVTGAHHRPQRTDLLTSRDVMRLAR